MTVTWSTMTVRPVDSEIVRVAVKCLAGVSSKNFCLLFLFYGAEGVVEVARYGAKKIAETSPASPKAAHMSS